MDLPFSRVKDGIIVEVKVDPRSSRNEIAGVSENIVKIKLNAPPVGGAANEALVELLAEHYKIRKSDVSIIKGASSRRKLVKIRGIKV